MFRLFKKKTKTEILQKKYVKLMEQWHKLSSVNRTQSDKVYAEAEGVLRQIDALQKK